jgi:hypothetical protein
MKQCAKPQARQKDLSLDELKSLFIKKQKEAKMENYCIHEMERDNKDMYIGMINWFEQVIKSRSKILMNKGL